MNHWLNEGKEILNQGRSKKQVETNYKATGYTFIGCIILVIVLFIFG
jgi:hypothetical protein